MNMLQTKKEELKKQGKKGFTLMELLIVVAIIAVLVAIAIPLFTNQLEKSREAVDEANIRDAYAVCTSALLTNSNQEAVAKSETDKIKYTVTEDSGTVTQVTAEVTLTQKEDNWQGGAPDSIGGIVLGENNTPVAGGTATVTVTSSETTIKFNAKTGA